MNDLTSRQRKLIYVGAIVALLIPIIWLGMPAGAASSGGGAMVGKLAELRQDYDLGEATLGDVDPSSATMNLVLLGLRGIAANALWHNANEQQKTKEWAKMRATVDSIILLQPHFARVWSFQGWNLAYNVSSVHDRVADRWYWVKEGGKFSMRGTERNARSAYLYHDGPGRIVGAKIGGEMSDERRSYRAFFQKDPDTALYGGGPDPGISTVDGEPFDDNFLAARRWHEKGCDADEQFPQPYLGTSRVFFHHQPARSQINSAEALHEEGRFGERAMQRWDEAYRLWTEEFGRKSLKTAYGELWLNMTAEELRRKAREEQVPETEKAKALGEIRRGIHYDYWHDKCLIERLAETQDTHRLMYDAKRMFREKPGRNAPTLVRATRATRSAADEESRDPAERAILERVALAREPLPRSDFVSAAEISNTTLERLEEQGLLQTVSVVQVMLEDAMSQFEQLLVRSPIIADDPEAVEQGMLAVLYWQRLHILYDRPVPQTGFPLEGLWKSSQEILPAARRLFLREMLPDAS